MISALLSLCVLRSIVSKQHRILLSILIPRLHGFLMDQETLPP